jgi:hypothetical protein
MKSEQDSAMRIAAAAILPVIGGAAFIIQPGFVQGLVSEKGFTEQQAGLLASAEVAGFAVSTTLLALLATRLPWRATLYAALLLCAAANAGSGVVDGIEAFGAVRFAAGLGAGAVLSIGWATLGASSKPDRNFGINLVLTLLFAAVVLYYMPQIYASVGFNGLLSALAALAIGGVGLVPQMPQRAPLAEVSGGSQPKTGPALRISAQASVALYFVGIGGVWAYLALIGLAHGLDQAQVATGLAIAQIGGLAGALLPVIAGARFGRWLFLAIAAAASAAPLAVLATRSVDATMYAICASAVNFGFNLAQVYVLSMLAGLGARDVTIGTATQWVALAAAPALAAYLIVDGSYDIVLWTAMGAFAIFLALATPATWSRSAGGAPGPLIEH